ncbi:MAG: endoglucanase A [Deltaproteobacteria bacterium]|nr:endoglucanase A [Deltaproteobacteria bacterium]
MNLKKDILIALVILICACSDKNSADNPNNDNYEGNAAGECGDDIDNDNDRLFDCDDPDCSGSPVCTSDGTASIEDTNSDSNTVSTNDSDTATATGTTDTGTGTGTPDTGTGTTDTGTSTTDTSAAGTVQFTINSSENVHPISPYIYGANSVDWDGLGNSITIDRAGGNRYTAFNWENNASNAGSDASYSSDSLLGGGDTAGEATRLYVQDAFDGGAACIITVPLVDYVAADKSGKVDLGDPNYLANRFVESKSTKGAAFEYPPNISDGVVYQDEFVNYVSGQFPNADTDPVNRLFYSLDNEPDLWSSTHREVHPNAVTYAELLAKTIEYATAIKNVNADATILGFVSYGFNGFVNLQSAPDAGSNGDFINYFLDGLKAAEATAGHRLVDVLDLHWYPEAQANSKRILNDDTSAAMVEARVQAPRSLWDPTYTEKSWIANYMGEPIRLLPRLKQQIADHYPGTKLAFTEYYYGGGEHISGGVAEADVLGIFGREETYIANVWVFEKEYVFGAIDMYRNYDGANSTFGDTHIAATTTNIAGTSIYASLDSTDPNRMVLVAINKTTQPLSANISITDDTVFTSGSVYQLTEQNASPAAAGSVSITGNAFTHTLPALSVTTIELNAQ